jgi:hypothetical protein
MSLSTLRMERYVDQTARWPRVGRHVLAQYDDDHIVVYQAYRPEIGLYTAAHQRFGGGFSFERMSWIKPNFLWMMFRSGWGTKEGQEITLAITLRRRAFDEILARAVHSAHVPGVYAEPEAWKRALSASDVRLQWDPDHGPGGQPLERRAIQLGLRSRALRSMGTAWSEDSPEGWLVRIEDVSALVAEQREALRRGTSELFTPREDVYPVRDADVRARLGLDVWPASEPR